MSDISTLPPTSRVYPSLPQQTQAANLEADRLLMESLAATRASLLEELQEQQQQQGAQDSSTDAKLCWLATTKASFFPVSKAAAVGTLEKELDQVDDDIRRVCDRVMSATEIKTGE